MRGLQYEGTPAEIAQGFKEQGNEMTRAKRWKDGKEFYTKGIMVLVQQKKSRSEAPHESTATHSRAEHDEELGKQREIEEACYGNRALCNLELSM